jgi:hypothetical protein
MKQTDERYSNLALPFYPKVDEILPHPNPKLAKEEGK